MISRYAQPGSLYTPPSLPISHASPLPGGLNPASTGDQFVPNTLSQPKFGNRLRTAAEVTVIGAALTGVALLIPHVNSDSSSDALPPDKKITQPANTFVTLDGQQSKKVTVQVEIQGVKFLFTGNPATDVHGKVNEDYLKACVRKVLSSGDNKMRADIFQFHPDKDVVLCELNPDDTAALTSWSVISQQSVTDKPLSKPRKS